MLTVQGALGLTKEMVVPWNMANFTFSSNWIGMLTLSSEPNLYLAFPAGLEQETHVKSLSARVIAF